MTVKATWKALKNLVPHLCASVFRNDSLKTAKSVLNFTPVKSSTQSLSASYYCTKSHMAEGTHILHLCLWKEKNTFGIIKWPAESIYKDNVPRKFRLLIENRLMIHKAKITAEWALNWLCKMFLLFFPGKTAKKPLMFSHKSLKIGKLSVEMDLLRVCALMSCSLRI